MNKPSALRAHLLTSIYELKHSPERLLIFINNGKVRCTSARTMSFEYIFNLQIILTNFASHPDSVILPLLDWLGAHQPEILENLSSATEGIQFEVDILDNSRVDLSLTLCLTERVVVGKDDQGNYTTHHSSEPQKVANFSDPSWVLGTQGTGSEWVLPR